MDVVNNAENVSNTKTLIGSKLPFNDRKTISETSAYIQSWMPTTKESEPRLRRSDSDSGSLLFEVAFTRTIDEPNSKRHVEYTILVKKTGLEKDPLPGVIERRYTDFLLLYMSLRQAFPSAFATFSFPRKLLTGNFAPESITARSIAFTSLFELIAADHMIRDSSHITAFMQNRELAEAKTWIENKQYNEAIPLVENAFRLLNKIRTDRHPSVLRLLCLLVACCDADNHSKAITFADIALHRYEAVSDADLLQYYVPLLQLCAKLYSRIGKENSYLEQRLADLKRRGIKVNGLPTLLEAVMTDLFSSKL